MADNSSRLDASGVSETLASDDIAGVKYQRVKLNVGPDGTAVDVLIPADAMTAANAGIVASAPELFNETTFDRQRGNTEAIPLALAARTASTTTATLTNYNARGVLVTLRITAASGTGGLQVRMYAVVNGGSSLAQLNVLPTAIIATGTYAYELYPGSSTAGTAGSFLVQQRTAAALPRSWQINVVHGDASSYTYEVGHQLIV